MATSSSSYVPEEAEKVRSELTDQEMQDEFADAEGGGNLVGADHSESSQDALNRAIEENREKMKALKEDIEDRWRRLKEKIANEIKEDELNRMKKLCESYLGGRDLSDIGMTVDLLQELEKNEVVGSFKTEMLSGILKGIGRTDLALEVVQYREHVRNNYFFVKI
ncbi:uncharacterized protein [Ptychodera flava]|uniref:uncharacterized protein n=1 Tax=Ptychodera flava TaxID=63121 RepID=UPI003969DFE2